MDKTQIKLTDLERIFIGNAPVAFMLEVFFRTIIVYVALLLIMRLLGKRMSGQLTIVDFAITIMLGAIVAPPMELPDRGILQGIFILVLVLAYHRGLSWWEVKNAKVETATYGSMSILVKNGLLQTDELEKTRVSRAQLYSVLRQKKIYNLGVVERVYLEACGAFTVFKTKGSRPGLSLLPTRDKHVHGYRHDADEDEYACQHCGATEKLSTKDKACNNCGAVKWDRAVI
ncbi:DUF421 domain-containing protein [Chitinophaga sp. S165]|uniref:DUF421 domain-containing protein n=1 Tax=Chitinophaga sp. S165 TaxID=2135462 RepID=UPI000D7130E8|nr:YetF domain-containing protein [Chitinophaga sp. S165]PWV56215.1 uncharacterized protein DUF421 [Chitinophaga sp. S165]